MDEYESMDGMRMREGVWWGCGKGMVVGQGPCLRTGRENNQFKTVSPTAWEVALAQTEVPSSSSEQAGSRAGEQCTATLPMSSPKVLSQLSLKTKIKPNVRLSVCPFLSPCMHKNVVNGCTHTNGFKTWEVQWESL